MAEEKIDLPDDDNWLEDFQGGVDTAGLEEGLAQTDIDQLLDTNISSAEQAATVDAGAIPPVDLSGMDQSQVDELLGVMEQKEDKPPASATPDQAEIDELFESVSKAEEAPPAASAGQAKPASSGADAFDLDFETIEADDFGFDEQIAEIPDGQPVALEPLLAAPAPAKKFKPKKSKRIIPVFTKKNLAIAASVALLVGASTFGYLMLKDKQMPAIMLPPPPPKVVQQTAPPPPPKKNKPPAAVAAQYVLQGTDGEVAMTLAGQDADGDPLIYDISRMPKYGKLAGELPAVTYLPDPDFPGRDVFEYTVTDGKATSAPVAVVITGPDLRPVRVAKRTSPKRRSVGAVDVTMKTLSTADLIIDWQKIWRQSNHAPFDAKVKVHIEQQPTHGTFANISPGTVGYTPEIYFSGSDVIKYRFERGGIMSAQRQIKVLVEQGDVPPEIDLRPLARSVYTPGETVTLDASASRDDARNSLQFSWQQLSGTPVQFKKLNKEGSVVSLIVPSSFSDTGEAQLALRVIVFDKAAQPASRDITIATQSRRQTALWRGTQNGGLALEPPCPKGDCAGKYLPWPFTDAAN